MRARAIEQGLKTFQEAHLALAPGWGRGTPSRLALAAGLAIVITLAGAEWQASRSAWRTQSWPAHLERFALALAENDVEAAADAWAEAYHGAMEADGGWRGPLAMAQAWQELVRRSRNGGAILSGPRQLYLTAMVRARDAGDLEGLLVIGNAMRDLGDQDAAEECLRIARGLATARPAENRRPELDAFEATLAASHREPTVDRLAQ